MANHLKEIQLQRLEELKKILNKEELQQYYNTHTYEETLNYYKITYNCSKKNLQLLFKFFNIELKGKGYNLKSKNREEIKQAMIAKYGVDNPQKSKEVREKTEQTNLKRYGFKNVFQNKEIREKQKETCKEKYGVENVFQAEEVKKTIEQTCLERYGVSHISYYPDTIVKSKQTKLLRYNNAGYHNWEQTKKTNLERYGTTNIYMNFEKRKQTSLERYGVDSPSKAREVHIKMAKTRANSIAADGTIFDSSWEVKVYEYARQKGYLIERNIPINYANDHITFIDFKINGIFYEVKGPQLLKNCWADKGVFIDNKINCYEKNNIYIITDINKIDQTAFNLKFIDINNLNF